MSKRHKDAGYDFLAITDHFIGIFDYPIVDTTAHRDDNFTTLIGAEMRSGTMCNGELWHIVVIGLPFDFARSRSPGFTPVEGQETGAQIAQRARDNG